MRALCSAVIGQDISRGESALWHLGYLCFVEDAITVESTERNYRYCHPRKSTWKLEYGLMTRVKIDLRDLSPITVHPLLSSTLLTSLVKFIPWCHGYFKIVADFQVVSVFVCVCSLLL